MSEIDPQRLQAAEKEPLQYTELRDVVDLSLWAGQLLLQYGAESERIEETVHHIGTGLGCDWMDILISPNAIMVTTISGHEFRTKIRRVKRLGVNMSIIDEINALSRQVREGRVDRAVTRECLADISARPRHYSRAETVLLVGLSCAAFSRLFGGDLPIFIVTFAAASVSMFVRQELHKRYLNDFLVVIITALVAGLIAGSAPLAQPELALTASVLLLVPGVPLINAAEDLIEGHMVTGIIRAITGGVIVMAIAVGLALAMMLTGVEI